jgi:DnaJ-class molecular chaperone
MSERDKAPDMVFRARVRCSPCKGTGLLYDVRLQADRPCCACSGRGYRAVWLTANELWKAVQKAKEE